MTKGRSSNEARMPQLCNGLAPEERADILRVRPQGALCTVVQQHCPTSGAPLVTVTYRSIVIDKRSRCQGIWLDCDEFLFFGEALERVLAKDQWLLGALKRSLT